MEITETQNKATNDIIEMVVSLIGNGSREIDTTEAISSTARLAGSFMFRSFDFKVDDAKPGTVMLSQEANTKGPQLVGLTQAVLHNFGIQIDEKKMSGGNQKHAESDFVEVIGKLQSPALEIMKSNDLNYEQMAQSSAIATGFIIQQSINITPEEGLSTAIYHYIEGTKTSPPDFQSGADNVTHPKTAVEDNSTSKPASKPWWKFW